MGGGGKNKSNSPENHIELLKGGSVLEYTIQGVTYQ